MIDKERLSAMEQIMDVVCGLCHWPYLYRDEETMYAEKCDFCPAALAVKEVLERTP